MNFRTKRIYDRPGRSDGFRVLVDRVWPRGVSKERAALDAWMRQIAPSDGLRRWFAHDPARWAQFQRRYFQELDQHPEVVQSLREAVGEAGKKTVTLLFAARDEQHNNAVALKRYLQGS